MKQFKAALFLSLGLISINAWSATTENNQQSVEPTATGFLTSPITILVLGGITLLCLIALLRQKRTIRRLKEHTLILEKANAQLESTVIEKNDIIATAKRASQSEPPGTTQIGVKTSSQSPTQQLKSGQSFDEALIDISVGLKKVRGKEDRYQSLLDEFITRKPSIVNQLTEYVGKSQMQLAKEFAQSMKEETGNLALDSLHFCLEDLENALIEDDLAAIHQKLVDLGRAWRITEREVQKYLQIKTA